MGGMSAAWRDAERRTKPPARRTSPTEAWRRKTETLDPTWPSNISLRGRAGAGRLSTGGWDEAERH